MFTRLDGSGRREFYLIVDAAGAPATGTFLDVLIAHAGEPIELHGNIEELNNLLVLRTDSRGLGITTSSP